MGNAKIELDILTNCPIKPDQQKYQMDGDIFEYYSAASGNVKITGSAQIPNQEDKLKLAGLCRHFYEKGEESPIISSYYSTTIFAKYEDLFPKNFDEKKVKMLEYLISKGGKEYKEANIRNGTDFTIIYGDKEELHRIMKALNEENLISVKAPNKDGYYRTLPTKAGIAFVEGAQKEENHFSNVFSIEEKEIIFSLIKECMLDESLEFIKTKAISKGTDVRCIRLLEVQFSLIRKEKIKGTLTQEELMVRTTKLADSILALIK